MLFFQNKGNLKKRLFVDSALIGEDNVWMDNVDNKLGSEPRCCLDAEEISEELDVSILYSHKLHEVYYVVVIMLASPQ